MKTKSKIKVEIYQDTDPMNPRREWDNTGIMVCFHKRYNLGDKTELKQDNFNNWKEVYDYLDKELNAVIILPIFLYDHSGISISTGKSYPFNDRWDAGQVGFIYTTKGQLEKMGLTEDNEKLTEYLEQEVKTYNQYLTGDVYGFTIKKITNCDKCGKEGEEIIDSCSGYYGSNFKENGLLDAIPKKYRKIAEKSEIKYS